MLNQGRLAEIGALIGNPGRANMLDALMDGRALTARELAAAGSEGSTAPALSRLSKRTAGVSEGFWRSCRRALDWCGFSSAVLLKDRHAIMKENSPLDNLII
jgi:hypothetical protein